MMSLRCFAVALALGAFGVVQAANGNIIWREGEVGRASIGYKPSGGQFTFRTFNLLASGPEKLVGPPAVDMRIVEDCIDRSFKAVRQRFEQSLAKVPQPTGSLTPEALTAARAVRDDGADSSVRTAVASFEGRMRDCANQKFDHTLYTLALVQRACDETTVNIARRVGPRGQPLPTGPAPCKAAPGAYADDPAAVRFSVLSYWHDLRAPNHLPLPADYVVVLPPLEIVNSLKKAGLPTAAAAIARCAKEKGNDRSAACRAVDVWAQPPLDPGTTASPPPARLRSQFEDLVAQARTESRRIDRNVPRIAGVAKGVAYRVIDALDEPQDAVINLPGSVDATLSNMQDELARARLTECFRFRARALEQMKDCAGYEIDKPALEACLAGSTCMPKFAAQGGAMVLAQMTTGSLGKLAVASLVPHARAEWGQLQTEMRFCLGTADQPKTADEARDCLLERQLPPIGQEVAKCIRSGTPLLDCGALTVQVSVTPQARMAVGCLQSGTSEEKSLCVLRAGLPPELKQVGDLVQCYQRAKVVDDLTECFPNGGGDLGPAAVCWRENPLSRWSAAACFAKGRLPQQASDLLECASQGTSTSALAGCLVANNLPESFRKPMQCVAETGAEPIGTGMCLVGDGFTPEQRIALQCIASTAAVPGPLATCVVGQLVIKELFNCVSSKAFEGNCMGKGNDIVKLFAALHIDLTPDTVVGQALNAPLDFIKFNIAAAQAVLGGVQALAENLGHELKRAEAAIAAAAAAASAAAAAAVRFAEELASTAANAARSVVEAAGNALGFRW